MIPMTLIKLQKCDTKMNKVHIKVHKINTIKNDNYKINSPLLLIKIPPNPQISQLKFTNDVEPFCGNTVSFSLEYLSDDLNIHLELVETFVLKSNRIFGKTQIPIKWFPKDQIVLEWFPIESQDADAPSVKILLEVHITTCDYPPFAATKGSLNVIPLWIPFDETSGTIPKVIPL